MPPQPAEYVERAAESVSAIENPRRSRDPEMDSGALTVSFVVPARNEEAVIARCLASIYALSLPECARRLDVIVVDNESTDATRGIAESYGAQVVVVSPGRPSRARNAGARHAQGALLAFVDADCELNSDWLSVCLAHFDDPTVVAVGAPQAVPDERASWVETSWHRLTAPPRPEVSDVCWLPSFNFLVRAAAFHQVNGFDEALTTCEDSDLSRRLAAFGGMRCDSHTAVRHLGEPRTLKELFRREMWRGADNLRSAIKRRSVVAEWRSLFLPQFVAGLWILAVVTLAYSLLAGSASGLIAGLASLLLAVAVPVAFTLRRKVYPWREPRRFLQCATVLTAYIFARAVAVLANARRPERRLGTITRQAAELQR